MWGTRLCGASEVAYKLQVTAEIPRLQKHEFLIGGVSKDKQAFLAPLAVVVDLH